MTYTASSDLENALREDIKEEEEIKSASKINSSVLMEFITRLESLEEEKKGVSEEIKKVLTEAKLAGFIPNIIKTVLKLRKKDRDEREKEEELLAIYISALGEI